MVLSAGGFRTRAADEKEIIARQKGAAIANMKKAGLSKSTIVESKSFLIATTLSEPKARALGAVLDRVVPVARKALQFEPKEEPWKGKLAVYYLPEGGDFKGFIRSVVVTQPGGAHFELRVDEPFLVDPVDVPAKATETEEFMNSAALVAGAYLKAKGMGASPPDWLVMGFGRATALRAEGASSKRFLAHKSAARTLAGSGGKPTELWSESKPAAAELLATSFVDYLAYGAGAGNFPKLIISFRPDTNGNPPAVETAFEGANWKDLPLLEAAWKKWAMTGKDR